MEKQFRYDFQTAVVETDKGLVHGYEYDGMSIFTGVGRDKTLDELYDMIQKLED